MPIKIMGLGQKWQGGENREENRAVISGGFDEAALC
jgi:hypothetical protein